MSSMRIGILISGRGTNMVALADAVREGRVPGAEIAVVLSDKPSAAGRVRALDGGPIITQRVVPVFDSDTVDTLAARILAEEHKAYPEALALVIGGKYEIV